MDNIYNYMKPYVRQKISYKEFCEHVGEKELKNSSKTQQLKRLGNYMDISSSYGNITINKVYNEQEMLLIKRQAKFTEYIEDLIIMYLANNKNKDVTLTYKEMAEYFCMVNDNYYPVKYNKKPHVKDYKMQTSLMYFNQDDADKQISYNMSLFFNITDKLIKEIIKNSLKSLKQRSLILYHDTFKLYRKTYIEETDSYIVETFICDKQEREKFLDLRKEVMERHNIKKLQDIVYLPYADRELYFQDLKLTLMECDELYNCDMYANAFTIEYAKNGIDYEYKQLISDNKLMLNNNMQFKLLSTKQLDCINNMLRKQFIDKLIER